MGDINHHQVVLTHLVVELSEAQALIVAHLIRVQVAARLHHQVGLFGDFTQMPTTYAEALQLVIDGRREFNALPLDVKNSFNNDFRQFLATAGTPEWAEKLSSLRDDVPAQSDVVVDQPSADINVRD